MKILINASKSRYAVLVFLLLMIVLALTKIDQQEIPEKNTLQKLSVVVQSVKDSARKSSRKYTLYFKQPNKYFYGKILLRSHQVVQEISDIKPGMELEVLVKQDKKFTASIWQISSNNNVIVSYEKLVALVTSKNWFKASSTSMAFYIALTSSLFCWLSHWYLVKIKRAKNA